MIRSSLKKALSALAVSVSLLSAQTANPKTPAPKGQKETEAVMAMFQNPDPDARIAAANNLVTKFAESEFKATAFYVAAFSYQQKGDLENVVTYAEKCLEADPKFYGSMLLIASSLAQRTREFDLDREEKLARVDKMASQALALIPTAPKPNPGIPDDQWEMAKKDFAAQAHEALGMAAITRKKYDACVSEFALALQNAQQPDPSTQVRQASCMIKLAKYDDAGAVLDKVLADPSAVPAVKQAASGLKADIAKLKAAK